jgi:CubicO group peptidase (beta-lactamase class C family)
MTAGGAGAPLGELLVRYLFTPAGLRETAWDGDHDENIERAVGYGYDGRGLLRRGRWVRAPFVSSSCVDAAEQGDVGVQGLPALPSS